MRHILPFTFLSLVALAVISAGNVAYCADCTTIQSGLLKAATGGQTLTTGYDQWGYNYQAHIFNGIYDNNPRTGDLSGSPWTDENCDEDAPYGCIDLQMKWNDAWLSNKDCDGDTWLDRSSPYIGSGAWLTNHQSGSVSIFDDKGREKTVHWTYFVKIVAVPLESASCFADENLWCESDGLSEIGPKLWGSFAIIQEVENDPLQGLHGIQYKSPVGPGFGIYGSNP